MKATIKRLILFAVGFLILSFGLVCNKKTGLGVSAVTSLPYAVSVLSPATYGQALSVTYFACVVIEFLITRKLTLKLILQIPFSYVFGLVVDVYDAWIPIQSPALPLALFLLLCAVILCGTGVCLLVQTDLVVNPADGLSKEISTALNKEYGKTKRVVDCVMVAVAAAYGLIFGHRIIGIGLGTVVSAVAIGTVASFVGSRVVGWLAPLVKESKAQIHF